MPALARLLTLLLRTCCRHEWVHDHRADRMWLRCLHCGKTTEGLEVGGAQRLRAKGRWFGGRRRALGR